MNFLHGLSELSQILSKADFIINGAFVFSREQSTPKKSSLHPQTPGMIHYMHTKKKNLIFSSKKGISDNCLISI